MAQVIKPTQQHIDVILAHLLEAWAYLPEAINEIDDWDVGEQIAYVEEWSPEEALLDQLREYDRNGLLNEDQAARYRKLLVLVRKHRTLLNLLHERSGVH